MKDYGATGNGTSLDTASADTEAVAMLQNIRDHGSETLSNVNHGLGGLWVNWRYGTSPLLVNFNGSGHPDAVTDKPPRHDELTDMRYLHNLWRYKKLHPADPQFDGDLARYTTIVKHEFTTNIVNRRGWMYDEELIPLWHLSGDDFYRQAAFHQAGYFADTLYRTGIGACYNTSSSFGLWDTHYGGYYGGLEFSGPTFQNPGIPTIIARKEGGRQMDLLEAFHLPENWVTTEAMGIVLEAMFSLEDSQL